MSNPIEHRLEQLYDHWDAFIDDAPARLLRWLVHANEFRGIEAWFAGEDDERAGQLPVVFLRFEDPFDDPLSYAATLRARLLEAVALAREAEAEAGPDPEDPSPRVAEFVPPPATGNHLRDLMATAEALCRQQGPMLPMLALVLLPARIADPHAWLSWLAVAVEQVPASVRLVVFDLPETEALRPLAEAKPTLVHSERVELDLSGAAIEISAEAGGLDQPEGRFRHAYVQLLDAIGERDLAGAQAHAAPALELAVSQGWGHLEVAVLFALGSALLQANDPQRAIQRYYEAEQRALRGEQAGEPWAGPLRLNARLAMAAAAVMAEAWPEAAQLYLDTVPVARALEDRRSELDCVRMAAYCRSNHGQVHDGWALGIAAVELGEAMDAETRASSTMAFAGLELERVAGQIGADWPAVERRLIAALGPDWRPKVDASASFEAPGREVPPP